MFWKDVNYLCHGKKAAVTFEVRKWIDDGHRLGNHNSPAELRTIRGVIECSDYDDPPRLMIGEGSTMTFGDALVVFE